MNRASAWGLVVSALALAACGAAPVAGDASTDTSDASTDVATDTGPFVPGAHDPLPQVPYLGGPVLADVHLVTIAFADDARMPTLTALGDWFFDSGYAMKVAREYGVKSGRQLAHVQLPTAAPTLMTDFDIRSLIAARIEDGTLPRPDDGTIYMLYTPDSTRVQSTFGAGCDSYFGYHSESRLSDGTIFSYGLVVTCSQPGRNLTALDQVEITSSHELIEAATDPRPYTRAGYAVSGPMAEISAGGEVGDICDEHYLRQDGFVVQRTWSNEAAANGVGSPCIPAPENETFYGVVLDPLDDPSAPVDGTVTFTLHAWSSLPSTPFTLSFGTHVSGYEDIRIVSSPGTLVNGQTATLTVGVSPSAPSGSTAIGYVHATGTGGHGSDYVNVPIEVRVQ